MRMSKGTKDREQLELDFNKVRTPDNVTIIECTAPRSAYTSAVYDVRGCMIVAQAQARKSRAERVLRSAGILA